jgi:hypothetical protein
MIDQAVHVAGQGSFDESVPLVCSRLPAH